jgi:hypothetical protein
MARDAAMTKLRTARVLIILGVLVSLCVSDNVGPRLLPLPSPTAFEITSSPRLSDWGPTASHAPQQGRGNDARVEMASAPQSRVGAERQSSQPAAHAPKFDLAVPAARPSQGPRLHSPSAESSALFSRPKGRAPPSLV